MEGLGIGTAHNTLANGEEDEEEKTTGASSFNQADDRDRQVQLNQLSSMLNQQHIKVMSGATPMNTQGQEESNNSSNAPRK